MSQMKTILRFSLKSLIERHLVRKLKIIGNNFKLTNWHDKIRINLRKYEPFICNPMQYQWCIFKLPILLNTLLNRLRRNPIRNAIAFLVCNTFNDIFFSFWKVFVKPIKCYEAYSRASSSRVANKLSWEHVLGADLDFKFQLIFIEDSSLAMVAVLVVVLVASKLRPIFDWLHGINALNLGVTIKIIRVVNVVSLIADMCNQIIRIIDRFKWFPVVWFPIITERLNLMLAGYRFSSFR